MSRPVFLLIISRDLAPDELSLIRLYGNVLEYSDCHINIPLENIINEHKTNYVIFDVRKKRDRVELQKINYSCYHYHIVAIVHCWEKEDDFIDDAKCENCLTTLPPKQAFKKDFDKLLLQKKIKQTGCFKNILRTLSKICIYI